jgi:hypothetical protein
MVYFILYVIAAIIVFLISVVIVAVGTDASHTRFRLVDLLPVVVVLGALAGFYFLFMS